MGFRWKPRYAWEKVAGSTAREKEAIWKKRKYWTLIRGKDPKGKMEDPGGKHPPERRPQQKLKNWNKSRVPQGVQGKRGPRGIPAKQDRNAITLV